MNETATTQADELAAKLDLGRDRTGGRRFVRITLWLLLLLLLALGIHRAWMRRQTVTVAYRTEPVQRGSLRIQVSATGNLEPRSRVDVGSELSGTLRTVEVDFNDRVTNGQVLARLDTSRLDAQVAQAEASLAASRARLELSKATVREVTAQHGRLTDLARLSSGEMPAPSELDAAAAALARAQADESASKAAITQWEATLAAYRTDRARMEIRSPIDGLVLRRTAQRGQTVAATFQSPILFTLAQDLSQMDLVVDVDEADIGKVREGLETIFTVDAFPDRSYTGRIVQVRQASQGLDNVVTYKTLIAVDNADLTLRPGMTAAALILVDDRKDVLLVPTSALNFTPPVTPAGARGGGLVGAFLPRLPPIEQRPAAVAGGRSRERQVYILTDGQPRLVVFTPGASDGASTEVIGGELREGAAVIVDIAASPR